MGLNPWREIPFSPGIGLRAQSIRCSGAACRDASLGGGRQSYRGGSGADTRACRHSYSYPSSIGHRSAPAFTDADTFSISDAHPSIAFTDAFDCTFSLGIALSFGFGCVFAASASNSTRSQSNGWPDPNG